MAVRFPQLDQAVDPADELQIDHLIACADLESTPSGIWCPEGVAIHSETNHIYIAERTDFMTQLGAVSIFTETGEWLNTYTHEHMKSLYGIAIKGNDLYVTDVDVHAVFHLKVDAGLHMLGRLGGKGAGIGEFNDPYQLAVSSTGDVYVTDYFNSRIQVLDSCLNPIKKLTHPSMHAPQDVKLSEKEIYVLSIVDSPCLHVFSYTGHKIRSLINSGDGMPVASPNFLFIGVKGQILISDSDANQIKIFSNEGVLLDTLGEAGNRVGMFNFPNGLALTSSLKLVTVSWSRNFQLQIFYYFPFN